MPKITAATVAQHHAQQRAALLAAAQDLLLTGGYSAMTFSALAERAGLGRSTVYSYFRDRDEVIVGLCEEVLPQVGASVEAAVARARTPRDRMATFVRAQLRAAGDRRYRLAHALAGAPLSAAARHRISELHHELMPNAVPILAELDHPEPAVAAQLLQGLINSAVIAMDNGAPAARTIRVTVDAALHGFLPGAPVPD